MKGLLLFLIRSYQKLWFLRFPNTCRFSPTCSEYSYQAIEKYGILAGLWLSIKRIIRCNPWHKGGFDPI